MGLPNIRWLLALITALHRFVYRVTGGWIGGGAFGKQFLLLSHTGRRSGQERTTPLLYVADGERWVVAASNAGDDRPPAWWLNLSARPEARIQVGRERVDIVARRAPEPDSERLWSLLMESYAAFDRYRNTTPREIPLVVLERRSAAAASPGQTADLARCEPERSVASGPPRQPRSVKAAFEMMTASRSFDFTSSRIRSPSFHQEVR